MIAPASLKAELLIHSHNITLILLGFHLVVAYCIFTVHPIVGYLIILMHLAVLIV